MKLKILRIILLLLITVGLLSISGGFNLFTKDFTVQAVGDLTVTWGVPEGSPIFVVNNFAPGQMETRTVGVSNGAAVVRPVGIKGIRTAGAGSIEDKLIIQITQGVNTLYGPKTLTQFFTDSSSIDAIPLSTLNPGANTNYNIKVTFDPNAGNEFQNTNVVFNLQIGIAIPVPDECKNIEFAGSPIFGTSKSENINGTQGNDLIFGLEGNDKIEGKGGDDCIVGGLGDDRLNGNDGNDTLLGNEGNDALYGNNNNDKLIGGVGDDRLYGGNGDDYLSGESGKDSLQGDNGVDTLFGGDDNDGVEGGNDNDTLDGGPGLKDAANGNNGIDSCINFESKRSCEL